MKKRMCVHAQDIARITGQSESTGRRVLARIKAILDKQAHQYVTAQEFSHYAGLPLEEVKEYL